MECNIIAKSILKSIGGIKNIKTLTHCSTRLRIDVYSLKKVNVYKLEALKDIVRVNIQGSQLQIIIGVEVDKVYKEIISLNDYSNREVKEVEESNGGLLSKIMDMISAAFTPILPAITGAGMIKAILAILVALNWINTENNTYYLLNLFSDGVFYFLPVMLAYTFASKLKCNVGIAMSIAGIMIHPNFLLLLETNDYVKFLGLPIRLVDYSGSVIPILLSILFMRYVEEFADRVSPNLMKSFLKPLITLLVMAPITLIAIGPIGSYISDYLVIFVEFLNGKLGWLLIALLSALMPVITMTGLHYSLMPIIVDNLSRKGFESIFVPAILASNIAQGSAALAVALKTKDSELKQLGLSSSLSAYCGITEAAMYGINLKFKKPFIAAMIGAGCAGLYAGIVGLNAFAFGAIGIIGLPLFITPDLPINILNALITAVISIVVTFIATWVLYSPERVEEHNKEELSKFNLARSIHICSPMNGGTLSLKEMSDDTFQYMGEGIAIKPENGIVYSPISGTIQAIFNTKHAIGLIDENGVEVLIHIGVDTVNLNGRHFKMFIEEGTKVEVGDKIVEFDKEAIEKEGYDLTTAIIVTNSTKFKEVRFMSEENVVIGEELLLVQ